MISIVKKQVVHRTDGVLKMSHLIMSLLIILWMVKCHYCGVFIHLLAFEGCS